jgi:hypothetical protein
MEHMMATEEAERLTIQQYCWRQLYHAGGRYEGFKFAISVNCDLDALKKKLDEQNEFLFDERRGTGGLSPGASPRLIAEGIVSALEEMIQIVEEGKMSADGGTS